MTVFPEHPVTWCLVCWYDRVLRSQEMAKLQVLYFISFPSSIHHLAPSLARAAFTQTASQGLWVARVYPLITSTNDLQNTSFDLLLSSSVPFSLKHIPRKVSRCFLSYFNLPSFCSISCHRHTLILPRVLLPWPLSDARGCINTALESPHRSTWFRPREHLALYPVSSTKH